MSSGSKLLLYTRYWIVADEVRQGMNGQGTYGDPAGTEGGLWPATTGATVHYPAVVVMHRGAPLLRRPSRRLMSPT